MDYYCGVARGRLTCGFGTIVASNLAAGVLCRVVCAAEYTLTPNLSNAYAHADAFDHDQAARHHSSSLKHLATRGLKYMRAACGAADAQIMSPRWSVVSCRQGILPSATWHQHVHRERAARWHPHSTPACCRHSGSYATIQEAGRCRLTVFHILVPLTFVDTPAIPSNEGRGGGIRSGRHHRMVGARRLSHSPRGGAIRQIVGVGAQGAAEEGSGKPTLGRPGTPDHRSSRTE